MKPADLRQIAERYRKMALRISDPQAVEALKDLAIEYEETAAKIAGDIAGQEPPPPKS